MSLSTLQEELKAARGWREGPIARAIERRTARLPTDVFLYGALASVLLAGYLGARGKKDRAVFISQWLPTILMFAFYNKLVKMAGSDRVSAEPGRPI